MWELDCEESWTPKNRCFWTVVLEKTLESPLDCKEIQPVHLKWDQSWVFIGRTDAEAESPVLWPPHAKSWLIGKNPDAGRDWRQEEKGTVEDEMAGWHHPLDGHEFEGTLGVGDGQGGLACCGSWGRKESDTTERLHWTDWRFPQCLPSPGLHWSFLWGLAGVVSTFQEQWATKIFQWLWPPLVSTQSPTSIKIPQDLNENVLCFQATEFSVSI